MCYKIDFEIKLQMIDVLHILKRIWSIFIPRLMCNAFRSHSLTSIDRKQVFDEQSISIYLW